MQGALLLLLALPTLPLLAQSRRLAREAPDRFVAATLAQAGAQPGRTFAVLAESVADEDADLLLARMRAAVSDALLERRAVLVAEERRDALLQEVAFSLSDVASRERALRLGDLLTVEIMVFIGIRREQLGFLMEMESVEVATARVLARETVSVGSEQDARLLAELLLPSTLSLSVGISFGSAFSLNMGWLGVKLTGIYAPGPRLHLQAAVILGPRFGFGYPSDLFYWEPGLVNLYNMIHPEIGGGYTLELSRVLRFHLDAAVGGLVPRRFEHWGPPWNEADRILEWNWLLELHAAPLVEFRVSEVYGLRFGAAVIQFLPLTSSVRYEELRRLMVQLVSGFRVVF